ncbi:MAG TPA: hypothetical protein VM687_03080 [Stenotrophomonas sp.]|nr:hypothetical protein [Stenotrophomonas sp.]
MPQSRARPLLLLLAPVALLAAVWWHRAGWQPSAGFGLAHAPTEIGATTAARPLPTAPRRANESQGTAVNLGLPLDRRSGFDSERDLYRYAQRLSAAADAGDAEAGWMLSRVYDYCAAYAQDPAGYAADSTALAGQALPGAATLYEARQRLQARCTGFIAQDALTASRILAQRTDAARAGNLAAEAALLSLGRPLQSTAEYRRDLVQRVLDSRDPEAYLAVSGAMGAGASGDDAYRGFVAGDQYAQLAWQLAACRLGLACDAGSNLMTSYCANGGICSNDASQDFPSFVLDAAVPRQSADKMDEMVNTLVSGTGVRS